MIVTRQIFAMILMLVGTVIFALIVSSASGYVANLGMNDNLYQQRAEAVRQFLDRWEVPNDVVQLVDDFFCSYHKSVKEFDVGILEARFQLGSR